MAMVENTSAQAATTAGENSIGGDGVVNMLYRRSAATLGLGWLIAITLCGGVSLFICVGFALTWRAQKRRTPLTITRTTASLPYAASGFTAMLSGRPSNTRLTKRRMMVVDEMPNMMMIGVGSDDEVDKMSWSRELSSRFSLRRIPSVPVLPPLPSYSTFRLFNPKRMSYRRERGWLDEENDGAGVSGQLVGYKHTARQRAGSGSGWAGQGGQNPPVQPPVGHRARMQVAAYNAQGQQQQQQQQPPVPPPHQQPVNSDHDRIYDAQDYRRQQQQQQQHGDEVPLLPTGPGADTEQDQDFVRPAAAVLAKHLSNAGGRTDSDLRDILRSTEQRLRDGRSRSPEKRTTPHGSPSKNSMLYHSTTPRSLRVGASPSSHGSGNVGSSRYGNGGVQYGSPTRNGIGAREGSTTSIGSAANSLIAQATQELQLPGGMGSPSRLRGHEWLAGDDAILQLVNNAGAQHENEMQEMYPLQREIEVCQYQKQLERQREQEQLQQQYANSPQRSPQRTPQRSERRRSTDSDASSSLSTLYSVGDEGDDVSVQAVVEGPSDEDPFVEQTSQRETWNKSSNNNSSNSAEVAVLRPLRRTMTVSSDTLARHVDRDSMPSVYSPQLQQQQQQQQQRTQGHHTHRSLDVQRFAGALQPPADRHRTEEVRPKSMFAHAASPQVSESSFTDISVDSTTLSGTNPSSDDEEEEEEEEDEDDDDDEDGETVMGDEDNTIRISGFEMMTTPVKESSASSNNRRRGSDASSSPFSEHDIVNMIIAAQQQQQSSSPKKSQKKRALPNPPGLPTIMAPDGCIVPTALSPPPKSVARPASLQGRDAAAAAALAGNIRKASVTSSNYGSDNDLPLSPEMVAAPPAVLSSTKNSSMLIGLPASRSAHSGVINGLSVCSSVAELRRMNSLVSVTSNNSLNSSVAVEQRSPPAPLLPNLADGRLPQLQSARMAPRMGSRQYLNVGGDRLSSGTSGRKSTSGQNKKKSRGHTRSHTTTSASMTTTMSSVTPERPAKNPRRSMGNVTSLVERYQQQQALAKARDNGKENVGLGITRSVSRGEATMPALQESRSGGSTPTKDAASAAASGSLTQKSSTLQVPAATMTKKIRNPVVAELAAAERRKNEKRGSVDSLGLYDKDGFLLPSPERELYKKLLRM